MQTTSGNNIQFGKMPMGKNPLALLSNVGKASAGADFSNILAMLTGGSAASSQLDEKMMTSLMNGEIHEGMTPEQASELKREALLTSKKHAGLKVLDPTMKNVDAEGKIASSEETSEILDLKKLLKTDGKKSVVKEDPNADLILKKDGVPLKRSDVALGDNAELLSLKQNMKSSKMQASKEYAKGQNPFENNVIQLKKNSKMEKESLVSDQETVKPFDLLVRDSSANVQQVNHEPKMSLTLGGAQQTGKTLDIGSSNNSAEIVNKIVNYLEQSNIQNSDKLEVTVKHDTLGQFNVNVQKSAQGDSVNMQILTQTSAGHDFFVNNENQLSKTLLDHGLKITDLKIQNVPSEIASTSKGSEGQSSSGNSSHNEQSGQRYYNEKQQSQNQDSRRRQELWEQFRERSLA